VTRHELVRALWMSEARLALPQHWFSQTPLNEDAYCQADDVAVFVDAFYRERKALVRKLEGRFALVSVTNTLLTVVGFVLAAIVVLAIWQIPSSVYLIPIGSAVLGLSFAFGKSAQDLVYSLYLVFSVAPYEIGDWVSLDDGEVMTVQKVCHFVLRCVCFFYVVSQVNLMTTSFRGIPEGRMVHMSNAEMYTSRISNWSRTKKMQLEVRFTADPRVTLEDVQYVREQIRLFVAEHSGLVADSFLCHVANSQQIQDGQVSFLVRVRLKNHVRYPNVDVWRPINTALTVRLMEALRRRDINSKILAGYEDPRYKDDRKAKSE
jgi:small-conductance mechanosensitive channel